MTPPPYACSSIPRPPPKVFSLPLSGHTVGTRAVRSACARPKYCTSIYIYMPIDLSVCSLSLRFTFAVCQMRRTPGMYVRTLPRVYACLCTRVPNACWCCVSSFFCLYAQTCLPLTWGGARFPAMPAPTDNLTPHQRWILQKRTWSRKRIKHEWKTKCLPRWYTLVLFAKRKQRKLLQGGTCLIIFALYLLYFHTSTLLAEEDFDLVTMQDLTHTNSVAVFEGPDLNGQQRFLTPGVHWTGLFCNKNSNSNFRSWQSRSPSDKWIKKHYQETIHWDEPVGFCPLSVFVPSGFVVEIVGSNGMQKSSAACQTPMRRHATLWRTKKYGDPTKARKRELPFISEHVRNTACHLLVVRKLNVIMTFYEFKRHNGRSYSVDQASVSGAQLPLVLWTGVHCAADTLPTIAYVQHLLPFTNNTVAEGKPLPKINFQNPIGFLPRGIDIQEPGYSAYIVYIKERGGCSEQSLPRWYYKPTPSATLPLHGDVDRTRWDDFASSSDLAHLIVITRSG